VTGGAATFSSMTNTGAETVAGVLKVTNTQASVSQNSGALQVTGGAAINGTLNVGGNLKVVGTLNVDAGALIVATAQTTITGSAINPLHVSSTSATQSGILLQMGVTIKGSYVYTTTTGMTINNGAGVPILQQGTGGTSDTSLLSAHNTLDDGTGSMTVVGTLNTNGISGTTLTLTASSITVGGTVVPGQIGVVTSSARTTSSGGTIASATFVTVNSVTLGQIGTYECTFRGSWTISVIGPISCQIGPAGAPASNSNTVDTAAVTTSGYTIFTNAAIVTVGLNTVIVAECNRPSGTGTVTFGDNRLACTRSG
jgi:hypothetical protein